MSPSNDLEKLVGERVTFTCVVEGIPTPTWYHNGGSPLGVNLESGPNRNVNTLTISSSAVGNTGMLIMGLARFRFRGPYRSEHQVRALYTIIYAQDLKNIKNVKGCRDGMPKSMQTR